MIPSPDNPPPSPDPGGSTGDRGGQERRREIGELEFLIGNACSRTITLLVAAELDVETLRDELAFLSEKAGRLARLLGADGDAAAEAGKASPP
jgi:hypothetical protein